MMDGLEEGLTVKPDPPAAWRAFSDDDALSALISGMALQRRPAHLDTISDSEGLLLVARFEIIESHIIRPSLGVPKFGTRAHAKPTTDNMGTFGETPPGAGIVIRQDMRCRSAHHGLKI
jgi:hypothetical protein